MKKIYSCLTCFALTLALTACGDNQQSSDKGKEKAATTVEAPAGQTAVATPEAAPAAADAAAPAVVKGKVAEVMDASGYTYIRLDDGSGTEVWAAAPKTELTIGEEITLQGGSVMENFSSKTLNKTFEKIIFATGVSRGDGQEVAAGGAAESFGDAVKSGGADASGGSVGNIVAFSDLKVEKAAGPDGQSVADLYEKAATLDKKNVAVKGQVVKVSKNIMGKNWIHIQDGTGDPNKNTHDLVVTTMETAEKGDIVTVEGPAAAAKDFGSGYKYDVIIEDAKVTK
ncbi:MAG: DNA-binding protein [Proteobacteria bacterium]|nr:DNA-binding protein [Desulfobulbaceae bacterium]MBU4151940.1 DNA-binding protein [Pseudomonadota bacterium]